MSKTIFISYGRDEQNPQHVELVKKVKNDLEEVGFRVLMDIERLHTGDDWQLRLENDITASDWVLFFITPYSARRPDGYCLNELSYALYKQKQIAPIMINYMEPPLSICRIQYLDLQKSNDNTLYIQKLKEIVSILNDEQKLGFEGAHTSLLNSLDVLSFKNTIAKHIYGFVGRRWIYNEVDKWLKKNLQSRVMLITAKAGYGKSALATYLSQSHPSSISIHFCQHDAKATIDPKNILKTFIFELSTQLPQYHEKLNSLDIKEKLKLGAVDVFRELLEEPLKNIDRPNQDLFFIIDALDEAQDEDGKNPLVDMIASRFSDLPSWLNIIITSRPEPALMRKLNKFKPLELNANEEGNLNDLKLLITQELPNQTSSDIVNILIKRSEGNMLYLKMMLEHETFQSSAISLEDISKLPQGMEEFYQRYFERKFPETDMYEMNLLLFVSILVASKEGMSAELIKYVLNINERKYKKIFESFGSLLEENQNKLSFYHKSLFDWLSDYDKSADYSADIDEGNELLAKRLWKLYEDEDEDEDEENKIQYEIYLLQALYNIKSYKKLEIILKDILFIGQIYNQGMQEVYKDILSLVIKKYSKKVELESLKIYNSFFREKDHLITILDDEYWKPSQSLFQLAYEDGENSPLSANADKILEENKVDFLWLKTKNRPNKFLRSGAVKVMKAHSKSVLGAVELMSGDILSYSEDRTLRLWDSNGFMKSLLSNQSDYIKGLNELVNGDVVSYSKDGTLTIWSNSAEYKVELEDNGSLLTSVLKPKNESTLSFLNSKSLRLVNAKNQFASNPKEALLLDEGLTLSYHSEKTLKLFSSNQEFNQLLEGHTDSVIAAFELANGNILSYSKDKSLILWNARGELISVMRGHLNTVEGAIELKNGNLVSYSSDETLILWSNKGTFICLLEGHSNYINGILELKNGDFISFSSDETLILWSSEGVLKTILRGHSHWVNGVIELENGNILSYSWDETLILWSASGEFITVLESHSDIINGVVELKNGNILSFSSDNTLILWDKEAILQTTGKDTVSSIKHAVEMRNGNILSCSMDKTLDVWDNNGSLITKLSGHSGSVNSAIELVNGNILSYSWDTTLRLWSPTGELLNIMSSHENLVDLAIGLSNGNIISVAQNELTLKLWNSNGEYQKELVGHTSHIKGVLELKESQSLSYSVNNILFIWDEKGGLLKKIDVVNENINGVLRLHNDNIILYTNNKIFILNATSYKLQEIMLLRSNLIKGVFKLRNGNLLLYSDDGIFSLYNLKEESESRLECDIKNIESIVELKNKNIVTYSGDSILRIWSHDFKLLYKINIFSKFIKPQYLQNFESDFLVLGKNNNLYFYELYYANKKISFNELVEKQMEFFND